MTCLVCVDPLKITKDNMSLIFVLLFTLCVQGRLIAKDLSEDFVPIGEIKVKSNGHDAILTEAVEDINNEIGTNSDKEFFSLFKPKITEDPGPALILTDYIKAGRVDEARLKSQVDPELFFGIKSHSGFVTVNETYNSNLFFWYFPSDDKVVNATPVIVWLQGGPGASSMIGLFDEIGPFTVKHDLMKLNPFSWNRNHSLLFIDNPVGTGFSFTNHRDGYARDVNTYGKHLFLAITQLQEVFPELKVAPLYVAGESYAGKFVPALGINLHRYKEEHAGEINLKGFIIGNALVEPSMIQHVERAFYNFGLLDQEQIKIIQPLLDAFAEDIRLNKSREAKTKWTNLVVIILFLTNQSHGYNFMQDTLDIGQYLPFLNAARVRKAIHVGSHEFSIVNATVNTELADDFLSSTKHLYEELLNHYKILSYCGQLDQLLPCVSSSEQFRTWEWNESKEFLNATRYPFIFNKRLAGFYKTGGRFTEVVVRGAGHMVSLDAPAPIQSLIERWTHDESINRRFGILAGSFLEEYVKNNTMFNL